MRIAVVGDTHGKIQGIEKELRRLKPKILIFTGDYYQDGDQIAQDLKLTLYGVTGNCDYHNRGLRERLEEIEGKRFLIVHGHQYGVKRNLNRLYYRGLELEADIILFGHTHISCCRQVEGVWLLNPGSPVYPRGERGSYALVEIESNRLEPVIMEI